MKKTLISLFLIALVSFGLCAQVKTNGDKTTIDGVIEFDKVVHDFGDVIAFSGPLTCDFTVKNLSSKPLVIYNVVVSCGCTDVKWTKEPIAKDKTGTITVTYNNEDGPYPFDKNVTAYFSGIKKPVVLKLRGVASEKPMPLSERYPVHLGNLGLKETETKAGNITQGSQKTDAVMVANIGKSPVKVSFTNVTPGLNVSLAPNPIPAGETAKLRYTISSDRNKWGKTWFYATPVIDGKPQKKIGFWAFIKEDFSGWTDAQKAKAAQPVFDTNTYNFGQVKPGTKVEATFTCKNTGKSDFVVYKVDSDWAKTTVAPVQKVPAGKSTTYKISIDTTGMPEGESMIIITMTTNTPNRPLVNLFIGGAIKK